MSEQASNTAGHAVSTSIVRDEDPFEELHRLEETFYQEGHALGSEDGARLGRIEGRVFGSKRALERFGGVARLHGHSIILGNRLPAVLHEDEKTVPRASRPAALLEEEEEEDQDELLGDLDLTDASLAPLAGSSRLEKHLRTLYALSEPASLSIYNTEDDVSAFDDRFKRAQAKATIVNRMLPPSQAQNRSSDGDRSSVGVDQVVVKAGQGISAGMRGRSASHEANIEDTSILQARH